MRCPAREIVLLSLCVLFWGCQDDPEAASEPAPTETVESSEILPQPFTAEQIRDEWVPEFQLKMLRRSGESEELERWTVVEADDLGAKIEFASIDEEGQIVGEARTERTLWTDLRDHASFPASQSNREQVTRDTDLGTLEGWLYTVDDPDAGTVTEFFFASDLPGAPVEMRIRADEVVVMELRQIARSRPEPPPVS